MKIIVITSAGKNWVGGECPPDGKIHGKKIIQRLFNVDEIMPADPAERFPITNGLDSEVRTFILDSQGVSDWLQNKKTEVLEIIKELPADGSVILHVNFRCKGGFQRSTVMAEELGRFLKEKLGEGYIVIVHHLTMELALKIKQALGVAQVF